MSATVFDMRSLLERAGFVIRGKRANCIHCAGRRVGTVSFGNEVAHCHRCKWSANTLTLARELDLLKGDCLAAKAFRKKAEQRARLNSQIEPFEKWREASIRGVSDRYRTLSKAAVQADAVLRKSPDCEEAWDALARFYHAEAQLSAAFDWLLFTKASNWLESDSTPVKMFETWRRYAA
jgi:hypothetical protein